MINILVKTNFTFSKKQQIFKTPVISFRQSAKSMCAVIETYDNVLALRMNISNTLRVINMRNASYKFNEYHHFCDLNLTDACNTMTKNDLTSWLNWM